MRSSRARRCAGPGRLPRRRTDRIEDVAAWLLTAAGLFVLLYAGITAVDVDSATVARARVARQELTRVDAVVLADGPINIATPGAGSSRLARYVDRSGRPHDVVLPGAGRVPDGAPVSVWVDRSERPVAGPPTEGDALTLGIAAGVGVVAVGALALGTSWVGVRRWLLSRNADAWAREWTVVEPGWSGRAR